jgi:hypothetical protein
MYKLSTYLVPTYFPTYLPIYKTYFFNIIGYQGETSSTNSWKHTYPGVKRGASLKAPQQR